MVSLRYEIRSKIQKPMGEKNSSMWAPTNVQAVAEKWNGIERSKWQVKHVCVFEGSHHVVLSFQNPRGV